MAVSIDEQIKCVEREIRMRQTVYPRLVARGRMTEQKRAYEIEAMKSVLQSLQALATASRLI